MRQKVLDRLFATYQKVLGKKLMAIFVSLSIIEGILWAIKGIFEWVETDVKYFF